jgi:hypothetical protein
MKASGNMEQLCWNTVFMKSVIMDPSSEADPYCWYPPSPLLSAGIFIHSSAHPFDGIHMQFGGFSVWVLASSTAFAVELYKNG